MVDSLLEFLRNGEFGPIRLGLTDLELCAEIGKPDERWGEDNWTIWRYGNQDLCNLQVLLTDENVKGIWLYFNGSVDITSLPKALSPENWNISSQTTVDEFTRLVGAAGVEWTKHAPLTFDIQTCIVLKSDVQVLLANDGTQRLEKIMLTAGSKRFESSLS